MTKLTLAERETIILFNEQDDIANIVTCNERLKKRLKTLSEKHTRIVHKDGNGVFEEYDIPKELVRIAAPLQLSDKERERRRERGRLLFEQMKNG